MRHETRTREWAGSQKEGCVGDTGKKQGRHSLDMIS